MKIGPRARVIIDNDFSGDPDDLFQLVHHVLSPSVEIPFVIGSHLSRGDFQDPSDQQADNAARIARGWLALLGVAESIPVYAGSNTALTAQDRPIDNAAARAIIAEAMRDDTDLPLFIALGAGLTEFASALMLEPRIAQRLTAVWIGGREHPGIARHVDTKTYAEYNHEIDVLAGCAVFNDFDVSLWQVPRDAYMQCGISMAELESRVRPAGELGRRLAESLDHAFARAAGLGWNFGETYVLGDSPLVLLTALTVPYHPHVVASEYAEVPRPHLNADGTYAPGARGGTIRVITRVDTRTMHEDLFAKLAAAADAGPALRS